LNRENRLELARGIAMAVVGTDNEIFLARVRDNMRTVVIGNPDLFKLLNNEARRESNT
jgi:hypothetical protein